MLKRSLNGILPKHLGLLLLPVVAFSSCLGMVNSPNAKFAGAKSSLLSVNQDGSGGGGNALSVFQSSYYAFARQNCASCHGASQPPLFAASNVSSAYSVAKNSAYINFASIANSRLVTYAGNGHCGLGVCAGNSAAAQAQAQTWANAENAPPPVAAPGTGTPAPTPTTGTGLPPFAGGATPPGGAAGTIVTATVPIPLPLPTGVTYRPMRWNLSQLTPANPLVAGAIFELEIQQLSETTYRVRNPRIAGLRSIVKVSGIHVFVKPSADVGIGVEDVGGGSVWATIIANAPISTLPVPLPVGPLNVAPLDGFAGVIGVRSNQDSLTITFNALETGVPLTANTFQAVHQNVLIPRCLQCHSTQIPSGNISYSTYAETRATVTPGNPNGSATFISVNGANARMPIGGARLSAAELNALSAWITAGAQNN